MWIPRSLLWKGKVTIFKTLLVPQVIDLFSHIYTPIHILEKIDKFFFFFFFFGGGK